MKTNPHSSFFAVWLVILLGLVSAQTALAQSANTTAGTQPFSPCQNVELSPVNYSFTGDGGGGFISVTHNSGCSFTAM